MAFDPVSAKLDVTPSGGGFDPSSAKPEGEELPFPQAKKPEGFDENQYFGLASPAGQFAKRFSDIPMGVAQLGTNIGAGLSERVSPAEPGGHKIADWLNDYIKRDEAAYQNAQQYKANQEVSKFINTPWFQDVARRDPGMAQYIISRHLPGRNAYELAGSILGSMALPASKVSVSSGLPTRIAQGATQGIIGAEAQPVTSDDYAKEAVNRLITGGAIGGAVPALGGIGGKVFSPVASKNLDALRAAGVYPTVGQTLGGLPRSLEEKARASMPFFGEAVASGEAGADRQFRTAMANKALAPIGKTLPKGMDGQELVRHVNSELSSAYDRALEGIPPLRIDTTLWQDLNGIRGKLSSLPPEVERDYTRAIQGEVLSRAKKGYLTGDDFKDIETALGERAMTSPNSTQAERDVARALGEAKDSLRGWLSRKVPYKAEELQKVNQGYANFAMIRKAAGSQGAREGEFSPEQAYSAMRAKDYTKDKGATAKGEARLQSELIGPARAVLARKGRDSGTAGNIAARELIENAGKAIPGIGASLLAYPLYSDQGRKLTSALLSGAPETRRRIANLLLGVGSNPQLQTAAGAAAASSKDAQ